MSKRIEIVLPKLGESITEATVSKWLKKVGDHVKRDESLLEVDTDKVSSEIPSHSAGVLKEIFAEEDQKVNVGALLAIIEGSADGEVSASQEPAVKVEASQKALSSDDSKRGFLSPGLMRLASAEGFSLQELDKLKGTGEGGRVSKKDLEDYIQARKCPHKMAIEIELHQKKLETQKKFETEGSLSTCAMATSIRESIKAKSVGVKSVEVKSADFSHAKVERVQMTGMRKAIADNMVRSFYEAPHASLIGEVDVTAVVKFIQKEKDNFLQKHGVKITITSFVIQAIAQAIRQCPMINSSLDGDTILMKTDINIGIAVSVEKGIMVPVIKQCQALDLLAISKAVADIAARARSGKLCHEDVINGTISMTNFGMSGTLIGIPIIRFPEVAIVGIGAIQKKVVALDDDSFGIRQIMHVTLTFDHRVIDGMYGCAYLSAFKHHMENVNAADLK